MHGSGRPSLSFLRSRSSGSAWRCRLGCCEGAIGALVPGNPPSLFIEAETADDREILGAMRDGHEKRLIIAGSTWDTSKGGCVAMTLGWADKLPPAPREVVYGG